MQCTTRLDDYLDHGQPNDRRAKILNPKATESSCRVSFQLGSIITMSATTTVNLQTHNIRAVPADYDLHHSGEHQSRGQTHIGASFNAHPSPSIDRQNPPNWLTNHRRIPAYRPINPNYDQSTRRVYQNNIERAFIGVMFTGVFLEAVSVSNILSGDVKERF